MAVANRVAVLIENLHDKVDGWRVRRLAARDARGAIGENAVHLLKHFGAVRVRDGVRVWECRLCAAVSDGHQADELQAWIDLDWHWLTGCCTGLQRAKGTCPHGLPLDDFEPCDKCVDGYLGIDGGERRG